MSIERYSHSMDCCFNESYDPDPDGEWVRYVDHAQRELEHAREARDLRIQFKRALELLSVNMPMASADEAEDWTEAVALFVESHQ